MVRIHFSVLLLLLFSESNRDVSTYLQTYGLRKFRNYCCLASYPSPPPPPPPESQNEPHPFHVKSDWEPPVQTSVALETSL